MWRIIKGRSVDVVLSIRYQMVMLTKEQSPTTFLI